MQFIYFQDYNIKFNTQSQCYNCSLGVVYHTDIWYQTGPLSWYLNQCMGASLELMLLYLKLLDLWVFILLLALFHSYTSIYYLFIVLLLLLLFIVLLCIH